MHVQDSGRSWNKSANRCHPDRKHFAKGLCRNCYSRKWKRENIKRKWHVNPIKSYIVYAYFDKEGTPIYVGRGTIDRALSHKYSYKNSSWWTPDLILLTMTCKDEWEAMEYEGKWGGRYKPWANKEGNRPFRERHVRRSDVGRE